MKLNHLHWKLFPPHKGKLINHTQSYTVERAYELELSLHSTTPGHKTGYELITTTENSSLINCVNSDPC